VFKIVLTMNPVVLILTVASFSFWLGINMITPIFPLYLSDMGAAAAEIGVIVAIPSLISIFIRLPLASSAPKIGRIKFLSISLFINSLSLFLYGFSYSVSSIYLIRLFHSLSIAAFGPVAMAFVSILTPLKKRGGVMGSYMTMMALAMVIGPGLTAILSHYMDYHMVFMVASIPTLIFSVILLTLKEEELYDNSNGKIVWSLSKGIINLFRNKDFILICLSTLAYSSSLGFFRSYFPIYVEDIYLLGAAFISTLYTARGVFNVLVRPVTGFIGGKLGVKKLIMSGMLLTAISFLLISLNLPIYILFIAMIISGIGWGMRAVSSVNFISLVLSDEDQEVGMAFFFNMFDIGIFVGSVSGGLLALQTSLSTVFWIYSIILAIGTAVLLFIKEKKL